MKKNRITMIGFGLSGCLLLVVSLLAGCSWSAESNGVRVNSPPSDDSTNETRP